MQPAIIAHRGASKLAKVENTLESFQLAIDIGSDYAEMDIRKTSDNKLIVFHNDNINGKLLKELTYDEICQESGLENYKVPLFTEVLKLCAGKIKLDIELKEFGYEDKILSLVKNYLNNDEYMLKSFLDSSVARIKQLDSSIKTGLLIGSSNNAFNHRFNEYFPERRIRNCKADFISPNHRIATPEFIKRMRSINKEIYVWTVNEPMSICKFINRKVDGIITDRPDIGITLRKGFNM